MIELMSKPMREIADAIGEADAWRLMEATHEHYERIGSAVKAKRPGRAFLYVPSQRAIPDWMLKAIGPEAAAALREAMPGAIVEVSRGDRAACAIRQAMVRILFYRAGLPESIIAMTLGCRQDEVKQVVNRPSDPAAMPALLARLSGRAR
jgi:hypothetical protein